MGIEDELNVLFDENPDEDGLRKYIRAEKNSALSFLIAGLVHDTKGLLTPIFGSAEVGKLRAEEIGNLEQAACFNAILESAVKLDRLISSFLDFSKRNEYTRGAVYINDILCSVITLYQAQYTCARINLKTDLKDVPEIDGYTAGLESVFVNMLSNALQSYEGIPAERPKTVTVRSYHKDKHIFVEFEDDGCGIKQEDQQHIFDFLFTTKEKGHGIGLAYAMMIIKESHFGRIYVESEYGKGTKFTIKIPDKSTVKFMREKTLFGPKS